MKHAILTRDEAARLAAAIDRLQGWPREIGDDEPGVVRGRRCTARAYCPTHAAPVLLDDGRVAYPVTPEVERLLGRRVEIEDRDGQRREVEVAIAARDVVEELPGDPEARVPLPPRDGLRGSENGRPVKDVGGGRR